MTRGVLFADLGKKVACRALTARERADTWSFLAQNVHRGMWKKNTLRIWGIRVTPSRVSKFATLTTAKTALTTSQTVAINANMAMWRKMTFASPVRKTRIAATGGQSVVKPDTR